MSWRWWVVIAAVVLILIER